MKKIFALVLTLMLVLGMTSALAVTISVERDGTYDSEAAGTREFTYYQAFRAEYTAHNATGGGSDSQGNPGTITNDPTTGVSYYLDVTADASIIAKYNESNEYFKLTESADGSRYIVEWKNASDSAATVQAAAQWIIDNGAYITTDKLVWNDATLKWSKEVDAGYYVLSSTEGKNLVAATTDINIKEKNTYPTIDKKQKKAVNAEYGEPELPMEIGKTIYYQVTIPVPADANKNIAVFDKMTEGLEWDTTFGTDGLTVTPAAATYTNITSTDDHAQYNADNTWQIKFSDDVVKAIAGQTITITYQATVTKAALKDTGRQNEVTLDYDNHHYYLPDHVNYTTYFAGIYKIDPNDVDANMAGVKFTLADKDGNPVYVQKAKDENDQELDYYIPGGNKNEVVTEKIGDNYMIKIRGLDSDKEYWLTETETKTGYNLLDKPTKLTLREDKGNAFDTAAFDTFDKVENKKGSVLPSTGGIGTTLFYVGGGILVVLAGILLVTKRRMKAED